MSDLDALLARAQRGDRGAFDAVVRRLHRDVFGYARRVLGDDERAADVTQETFVRAWRYRSSFDPGAGSVRSWVFAIAANRVRDQLARRRLDSAPAEELERVAAPGVGGLEAYARGVLREHLLAALEELPAEQREVIGLKYLADLSYPEVARALGLSVGAAKMRALRAREALARALARYVESAEGEVQR